MNPFARPGALFGLVAIKQPGSGANNNNDNESD
jgi:hypothetical protein